MPKRYWAIAPFEASDPAFFNQVWEFDRANNVISIGWCRLDDVSAYDRQALDNALRNQYPNSRAGNMIWSFFHEIKVGDIVVARKGRKALVGVGTVTREAYYAPGKNPSLTGGSRDQHPNFIDVAWNDESSEKGFDYMAFPMHTVSELSEARYQSLLVNPVLLPPVLGVESGDTIEDQSSFALEKHLEDFIVRNFARIFGGALTIFNDTDGYFGQQYTTDIGTIDILAIEPETKSFVVIELKRGRPSDQVVGQILRYMGWVKEKLCTDGQSVRGLVICHEEDPKLKYALSMTDNIKIKYYSVSFSLSDEIGSRETGQPDK